MLYGSIVLLSVAAALQTLPPIKLDTNTASNRGFSANGNNRNIYLESAVASQRDKEGLTLIPPSFSEFAETFKIDLESITNFPWTIKQVESPSTEDPGIFLGKFRNDSARLTYENGNPTEEGYELEIANGRVFIGGTGARGMFWGTRTLLQQIALARGSDIAPSRFTDAPAYPTRGYMLDAGRKWYAPSFLKELCTYASFFKLSEFHYHTSDNYPLNRGHNETWNKVYSQFSLRPENSTLQGIIQRRNETLSREDFEDLQSHCAQRGITVVPEIESPGHCLSITKWKPELALPKKDLLNLTHPDAIPIVKSIWAEFLPWFQSKEVHIGADEYNATLADDYIRFVNEMSDFVNATSGKRVRIWGTNEPSKDLEISKDVIIQHWQYGQSDPVLLEQEEYDMVNSQDWWAYMSLKNDHTPILPAPYPAFFNVTRTLNFANRAGWQWEPSLFNQVNTTMQLNSTSSHNKGSIIATWNDNGPDATTQLEAFYAIRDGIPIAGSRAWAGSRGEKLDASTLLESLSLLQRTVPGQNLDRTLPSQTNSTSTSPPLPLFAWASPSSPSSNTTTRLGRGSKGMNYTLMLTARSAFTISSSDTSLSLTPSGALVFNADGWDYPLRSIAANDGYEAGLPGRIWANATNSSHEHVTLAVPDNGRLNITMKTDMIGGSRVWVDGAFKGRFEVYVFGGRNTLFSWSQMAFVAPLEEVNGGLEAVQIYEGLIEDKELIGSGTESSSGTVRNANYRKTQWIWACCMAVSILLTT